VEVSDTLDSGLDLSTLSLSSIAIGNKRIPLPATFSPAVGLNRLGTNIDLRPVQDLFVNVEAKLNPSTRLLIWTLTSIDPTTGLPPTDPSVGFLPPGAEGSVVFVAKPKSGLPTDTVISNQASVVFNGNAPILTPMVTNTIDNSAPVSHVLALPKREPATGFQVQWSGTDVGAGIQDYTIYVSDNGKPFAPFVTNTADTSATFTGKLGHVYDFYSIARDWVGNVEPAKILPEAMTTVTAGTPPTAKCQNVTVPTDPGVCTASTASVDNGSSDPDGDAVTLS
jgi:hypothetical protein